MDLDLLEGKLEKAFARSRTEEVAGCTLKWRRAPAPLWKYVEEAADADEQELFDEGSLEHWPGSVSDLLGERLVSVLWFLLGRLRADELGCGHPSARLRRARLALPFERDGVVPDGGAGRMLAPGPEPRLRGDDAACQERRPTRF